VISALIIEQFPAAPEMSRWWQPIAFNCKNEETRGRLRGAFVGR